MSDTAIVLLIAHFIGDYILQQHHIFLYKQYNVLILLLHTFIWSGIVSLALVFLKRFAWWKYFFLLVGHTVIDFTKLHFFPHPYTPFLINIVDQALHMAQLYIVMSKKPDSV